MSGIDRRAFAVGCFAVTLTGCKSLEPGMDKLAPSASYPADFRNNGAWLQSGDTLVYVVAPGFKP